MFSECFKGILRTGRSESTGAGWFEWRNAHLIESDEQDERKDSDLPDRRKDLIRTRFHLPFPAWTESR